MKRLLLVGALGVLLVLGVPAVASASPSFGESSGGANVVAIVSSNLISQTTGHHGMETLIFSQEGGFGGGALLGAGFEQQIVVQLDTENGDFSYTGTGLLSGPLAGATTVKLAQAFITSGEGMVEPHTWAANTFLSAEFEASLTSDSKTANVSIEFGAAGFNLLGPEQALVPPGTVAIGNYVASWVIH
jgi:hypothetical protein